MNRILIEQSEYKACSYLVFEVPGKPYFEVVIFRRLELTKDGYISYPVEKNFWVPSFRFAERLSSALERVSAMKFELSDGRRVESHMTLGLSK